MTEHKFTRRQTMHLNFGAKGAGYVYDIHRDGRPTGITLSVRLAKRPWRETQRVFTAADGASYDAMAPDHTAARMFAWLAEHSQPALRVIEGGKGDGGTAA